MRHVSLKFEPFLYFDTLEVAIQYVTPAGIPAGVDLAVSIWSYPTNYYPTMETHLLTFSSPFRLIATVQYAIILRLTVRLGANLARATYEAPPSHYSRGKLIRSTDAGSTWDTTNLGDLFFAEWGDPPVKPSKIDPPLANFATVNITYTHWDIGLVICLATNVPCHLTCYYTDIPPRKHHTSRVVRGATVPWRTYFCFVAWKELEQSEYGATLYHTFDFSTWKPGQERWFTFRGEVDLTPSPSIGPIFHHTHPGGYSRILTLRPNAPGDLCQANTGIPNICPNHYLNVNEEIPDEDTSYVEHWEPVLTGVKFDLYKIQTAALGTINYVALAFRAKRVWGAFNTSLVGHSLKTHGTQYNYPYVALPEHYVDRFRYLYTNPFTNKPWTQAEINDLQIGTSFNWYTGGAWLSKGRVTQVYAIIERGITCPSD